MSQSQFKTNLLNMKRCPINHKQISIITHDIVKRVKNPKDYCKQSTTQRPPVTNMCALYIEIFFFMGFSFKLKFIVRKHSKSPSYSHLPASWKCTESCAIVHIATQRPSICPLIQKNFSTFFNTKCTNKKKHFGLFCCTLLTKLRLCSLLTTYLKVILWKDNPAQSRIFFATNSS